MQGLAEAARLFGTSKQQLSVVKAALHIWPPLVSFLIDPQVNVKAFPELTVIQNCQPVFAFQQKVGACVPAELPCMGMVCSLLPSPSQAAMYLQHTCKQVAEKPIT